MERPLILLAIAVIVTWAAVSVSEESILDTSENSLKNIDRLWDYSKPDESEERFRSLLADADAAEHLQARIGILTQIARAQGLQRKFEDANSTLDEAEGLLTEETEVGRIRVLLERGRVHNSSGDAKGSRVFFERALDTAREAGAEYYAVDAAHMLGIVTESDEQIAWNLRAMEMAEAAEDPRAKKWLGALYNNTGWTYHDLEDYEKAGEMLAKALAWYEDNGSDRQIRVGKWSVAKIMRLRGRAQDALKIQQALEVEWEAARESNGYVFEELGECLLALGREEESRSYYARAYQELSKDAWTVANEPERLKRLMKLGQVESK